MTKTNDFENELTATEKAQVENFDATPLEQLSDPIPQWKKDVDLIESLLS